MELAKNKSRVYAFILDLIFLILLSNLIKVFFPFIDLRYDFGNIGRMEFGLNFFDPLLWFVYFLLGDLLANGSIGKIILNIKVSSLDGEDASFVKLVIRNLIKCTISPVLLIGFLMAFFNDRNETLHDKIAKTSVVNQEKVLS